jgi:N-acetylmuramoyl-L-alanine amidase
VRAPGVVISLATATALVVPAAASAAFLHVVVPGESLSSVAAADGLTVAQLAAANGLLPSAELAAGSQLVIPPQAGGVPEEAATPVASEEESDSGVAVATSAVSSSQYVVQPGDTLTALAARAGTTVAQLAAANGLDPNAPLLSGMTLTLDGAGDSSSQVSNTASAATSQSVGVAAESSPGGPPYPTPQTVGSAEVSSIAAADGVPPSLANAIAYQESGFNNELVSSANARGVMQITPGTWSWIDETLAGPTPLAPASVLDNVRGGVLLLHSLLQATGGNEALAAAGYYQGLSSVLQEGMYPSTQQYVADIQALQPRFGGE